MKNIIALGLGNNTDYELVWDSKVFEACIREYGIFQQDLEERRKIFTEKDLVITLLQFFQSERGGECVLDNPAVASQFASRFRYDVTIGGTCPRAGIAMDKLGYSSCMHLVTMNDEIRKLLPEKSTFVCSNPGVSYDVHLIIQYTPGKRICANDIDITTVRANRIIVDDDHNNQVMNLSDDFFMNHLADTKVFLVSGFNVMVDHDLLKTRLLYMRKQLKRLKKQGTRIFYEDACFVSERSNELCKEYLFDYVDVYSFNEDEMSDYVGCPLDLLDAEGVAKVAAELQAKFQVPLIVVHSRYWALAYGERAPEYVHCLKGGVTMATTRFRFGDAFVEAAQYEDTYNLPALPKGRRFADAFHAVVGDRGYCVPAFEVPQEKATTIGLGDAFVGGFVPHLAEM
jgi:ADP-dependent phosphofructokinase/glucokinase